MGKFNRTLAASSAAILSIALIVALPSAASADSVSVSGQVGTDQCPSGYQYSTGISVNASTGELTTICNAPPSQQQLLEQQQDVDFRSRIEAAQAAAQLASQAWNAANPGQQKCVQWGPITHANGVSTSSGGVCANPVTLGQGQSTPSQDAEDVVASVPVLTPNQNIVGSGQPFFKEVSGQVGTAGCPAGFQAANGLVVNAATGQTTTQCWSEEAWAAYKLGGTAWQKYQDTGGGYDVAAEIDRRAKLADLIKQAKTVAQTAADSTPGVKRCSRWTGYGETGQECAYTFVTPNGSSAPAPIASTDTQDTADLVSIEATQLVVASSVVVKQTAKATTKVKSLTPKVCKVSGLRVKSLKAGTCNYSITVTKAKGKKSTVKKAVVFIR